MTLLDARAEVRTPQQHIADLEQRVSDLEAKVALLLKAPTTDEPPLPETAIDVNSVLYPFGLNPSRGGWL